MRGAELPDLAVCSCQLPIAYCQSAALFRFLRMANGVYNARVFPTTVA
jgi:hypothetical protein